MNKTLFTLAALVAGLACAPAAPAAGDGGATALRDIMRDLDASMQQVAGATAREDWAGVARLAPMIGKHAQPPVREKMRILSWLGGDAGRFRALDRALHDAALALGTAAQREDGEGVIATYADVQRACLACHEAFRPAFVARFHDER